MPLATLALNQYVHVALHTCISSVVSRVLASASPLGDKGSFHHTLSLFHSSFSVSLSHTYAHARRPIGAYLESK